MLRLRFALVAVAVLATAAVFAAPPPATHYRSIGTAADYNVGTVTAINGQTYIIGSLDVQWKSANRGQGDQISIEGTDYTILSVDAENELTLTAPYTGATTYTGNYVIARKFNKLKEWEDCIEATVLPCDGVTTPSLPTDERVEIGVVYKDSPFLMNTGGEQLKLDAVATSSNYDITLTTTPPNRHHGIINTGVILDNGIQGSPAIDIQTSFVTIEWIELHHGGTTDQVFVAGVGPSSQIDIHNVMFYDVDQTSNGFRVNDNDANVLFFNNVLYGLEHGVDINGLLVASSALLEFYHNTFFQNVVGMNASTSTPSENDVIFMNGNLAINNGTDFNVLGLNCTFSPNNWSSDATASPCGSPGTSPVGLFNSILTPVDLHIRRGSIVEDNGVALSAVNDDLDGRPRGSPDIGADESDSSSANRPKILTAKSAFDYVQLEWQHPDFGPMSSVEVWRDGASFPSQPGIGVLACTFGTPLAFTKGQCTDTGAPPVTNGNTYRYSIFVYDSGGNYSTATNVIGEPFDNAAVPPEWSYATAAATLDPAGVRGTAAFAVSNDDFFHSMQGTSGATGGEWPLTGWAPYELPDAVQHRPVIVDVNGSDAALLGAQDGRVYAVDIATGKLVWKSAVLGTSISAAPAALVGAYGATGPGADKVYVGTSDPASNALFVLDLMTGATVTWFDDLGQPTQIGAITGVAVKYQSGPVFFTSDDGAGGFRNVWSLDVSGLPAPPTENWSYKTSTPIDSGPTRYKGLLLAGSRDGKLYAWNEGGPATPVWSTSSSGDGAVQGPIFPVWPNDTVLFTTDTTLHSVQTAATGGCGTAPCIAWSQPIGGGANLSPVLVVPGTNQAFTGDATGSLFEINLDLPSPMNLPLLIRPFPISTSALGGPAFSLGQSMLYVSDTSGKVHGIPWSIP